MTSRNKGFLNLNRFKSSKTIKHQRKYIAGPGKSKPMAKTRLDGIKGYRSR